MPIPTPFHPYTAALNESFAWRDWSGYLAAASYEILHDREYYAIRNAAALIDVSPLFKYEFRGPDAGRLANRIMTRDIASCSVGQVVYSPWCDDDGTVIDDGTVSHLEANRFRVTAAHPNLAWFQDCALGMDVQVADVSSDLAALALQGPNARSILQQVVAGIPFDQLKYYHLGQGQFDGRPVTVTRTGYTGDLGYELWVTSEDAGPLWERLMEAGAGYGLQPAGMLALDIARIEAGLLLIDVDYISSRKALIPEQKSTPYDLGLAWAVNLKKGDFVGRKALMEEKSRGSTWQFVGLDFDWDALEALYRAVDLAPQVAGPASRSAIPVYKDGRQIGQATSHTFSPILKKYIALATLETSSAKLGSQVEVEFTVEYVRRRARAEVVKLPFFNPPRKRA